MRALLKESADKRFSGLCTTATLGGIESGAPWATLWAEVEASGFADAWVPESDAGAGLSWYDTHPVLLAAGEYALPVALGPTMLLRAHLARAGLPRVGGPITLATQVQTSPSGAVAARRVPFGRVSDWVALDHQERSWLLPVRSARIIDSRVYASLQADLLWNEWPSDAIDLRQRLPLRESGAAIWVVMMAGAMAAALKRTLTYAGERHQFGRSIGQFQAVQQQLSLMAEHVHAVAMAAEMVCCGSDGPINAALVAMAKARASEAVGVITAIAHGVHGAIGITQEYPLHFLTRRLHEWRMDFGSETYWQQRLGSAFLSSPSTRALDFVLESLSP